MAKVVPFDCLYEGGLYWQEGKLGGACVPCRVIDEIDSTHVRMTLGKEAPWTEVVKPTPIFRYWDDNPTKKEMREHKWN